MKKYKRAHDIAAEELRRMANDLAKVRKQEIPMDEVPVSMGDYIVVVHCYHN